ncbi:MAG: ABC-2 type transport system permease protein [Myxococcota bacterium]|jgi:ABC-2 type transport system permease protein
MRAFSALLRKELFALSISPFVYVLLAVWFILNALLFNISLDTQYIQADLSLLPPYLFGSGMLVWLLLPVFPPLLCLRLFAEEHRVATLEPLLTAPITDIAVVLAKYLAACLFFLVFWGGLLFFFLILDMYGADLDWARVMGGFVGSCLMSFLFIATSLFASSWGGNLVLAAGGGAAINYTMLFVPALFQLDDSWIGDVARNCHLPNLISNSFASALIDSYAVLYLILLSVLFLFLTYLRLVSRRWIP